MATKLQTKWNLSCFYSGLDDPALEKDLLSAEKQCRAFAKKHRSPLLEKPTKNTVASALKDYEKLQWQLADFRPILYLHYLIALDTSSQEAQARLNQYIDRLTKTNNELAFFEIALGKLSTQLKSELRKDSELASFRYYLECVSLQARHQLSEPEEKLLARTSLTSYSLWTRGVEKALYAKTVRSGKKTLSFAEAVNQVPELPTAPRRRLHKELMTICRDMSDFAESELNAIVQYKRMADELRGFATPFASQLLASQNKEATIRNLAESVRAARSLSHRFYRAKAKIMGLKKLQYADRAARVGTVQKKYPFSLAYREVDAVFAETDPEFSTILERLTTSGQVDVAPKKGKQGGAFCSSSMNNPTFVLLNHVGSFDSVLTLAHEMGHAIHSELSKSQPALYQSYSLSTAETASTFFESLAFDHLTRDFSEEEKVIALHNRLQDDTNTIFRQMALFSFEEELHQRIREHGGMSHQEMAQALQKHLQNYLGNSVEVTEDDGYSFVQWPHIRYFFYVFTYAFGLLVSKALVSKVRENPSFIQSVKQFLRAGGSATPEDIFRSIGVDIQDQDFFAQGLRDVERDVRELEKRVGI